MKLRSGKVLAFSAAGLFIVLRVIQYVFAMDGDGFFMSDTLMQTVISYALYAVMGIFTVCAFVLFWTKANRYGAVVALATCRSVGLSAILYAITLLSYSVFLLMIGDWLAAFTFTAALYYFLLALRCERARVPMLSFMALFALGYPCARTIRMFFDTFKEIKASETVVSVLAECSAILTVIVLTKLFMQFEENMSKVGFCLMLGVAFGGLSPISAVLDMMFVSGLTAEKCFVVICDAAFWCLTAALLCRCAVWEPVEPDAAEIETITEDEI